MCENTNLCCDVCASTQVTVNCLPKIEAIIQAVNELPSFSEKGSNAITYFHRYNVHNNYNSLDCPVDMWFSG